MVEEGHIDDVDAVIGIHVDPSIEAERSGFGPARSRRRPTSSTSRCTARRVTAEDRMRAWMRSRSRRGSCRNCRRSRRGRRTPRYRSSSPSAASAADVRNIITGEVVMEGTIRTMDESVRAFAHERIEAIATALAPGARGRRRGRDPTRRAGAGERSCNGRARQGRRRRCRRRRNGPRRRAVDRSRRFAFYTKSSHACTSGSVWAMRRRAACTGCTTLRSGSTKTPCRSAPRCSHVRRAVPERSGRRVTPAGLLLGKLSSRLSPASPPAPRSNVACERLQ